jgi:hypothetical protein
VKIFVDLIIAAIDLTKNEKKVIILEDGLPCREVNDDLDCVYKKLFSELANVSPDYPDYVLVSAYKQSDEVHIVYACMIPETIKIKKAEWRNISNVQNDSEFSLDGKKAIYEAAYRI